MSVKTDIKYNNTLIDSLTSTGSIEYDTNGKVLLNNLKIEFTGTEDATADGSKILSGYTAYIADGSKATGTINEYDGTLFELKKFYIYNPMIKQSYTQYNFDAGMTWRQWLASSYTDGWYAESEGKVWMCSTQGDPSTIAVIISPFGTETEVLATDLIIENQNYDYLGG